MFFGDEMDSNRRSAVFDSPLLRQMTIFVFIPKPNDLLDLILKAVLTGFFLSILIGPVFFVLLETSIRKGIRAALAFDFGVFVSDLIYVIIAYLFYSEVSELLDSEEYKHYIKLVGGLVFSGFGLFTLSKKPKEYKDPNADPGKNTKDYLVLFIKGFFLNFTNPAVIFYWVTAIAYGAKTDANSGELGDYILLYITILLATFFGLDVLKIVGAKKLRPFITDRVLLGLNRLTGLILLIFGLVVFAQGLLKVL